MSGSPHCVGNSQITQPCNVDPCGCSYSNWGNWSECSNGVMSRQRLCSCLTETSSNPDDNPENCDGTSVEEQECVSNSTGGDEEDESPEPVPEKVPVVCSWEERISDCVAVVQDNETIYEQNITRECYCNDGSSSNCQPDLPLKETSVCIPPGGSVAISSNPSVLSKFLELPSWAIGAIVGVLVFVVVLIIVVIYILYKRKKTKQTIDAYVPL